jgi:ribonuclease HI
MAKVRRHHRIIYTGASEKKPGTGGVGIIMNKTLGKKVKSCIQYNDILIKL